MCSVFGREFSLGETISQAFLPSLALAEAQGCFRQAVEQKGSGATRVAILAEGKGHILSTFLLLHQRVVL